MTLHYHGTPITPLTALYELAGCCLCVSHARPDDVLRAHQIGQSVLLDNGAFSLWTRGELPNWSAYYEWCERWLDYPTTWAVIPDVIEGDAYAQEALIEQWPHGNRGAPVWHMHESIGRLLSLVARWPKVCIGSSDQYAVVMASAWQRRMDEAWNAIGDGPTPWIHMLRGMQCAGQRWPFASLDSTDVARNHNRLQNTATKLARRWDMTQCPAKWVHRSIDQSLFDQVIA